MVKRMVKATSRSSKKREKGKKRGKKIKKDSQYYELNCEENSEDQVEIVEKKGGKGKKELTIFAASSMVKRMVKATSRSSKKLRTPGSCVCMSQIHTHIHTHTHTYT